MSIVSCRNDPCVEGGESTLLDAYPVVKQLEKENPHHFEVLSTVQVPHMKIEYVAEQKFDMRYATPHIILDKYGEVVKVYTSINYITFYTLWMYNIIQSKNEIG